MNVDFFIENSYRISRLITKEYSTSFSLATSLLEKDRKKAIYAIYGFVRLADEIVDSFHGFDKSFLLDKLKQDLDYALKNGISTNTILTAFADTVKKYSIDHEYIQSFIKSMEYDLTKSKYTNPGDLNNYIYGSADVVGLMCLKVFCNGSKGMFDQLKPQARKLGSAFQKVNFLRDLKDDVSDLGRSYFPEITHGSLNQQTKCAIEQSIEKDFDEAWTGVKLLKGRSKLAVALAYFYYKQLFLKIKRTPYNKVIHKRIRISNLEKYLIIMWVSFKYKTKLI